MSELAERRSIRYKRPSNFEPVEALLPETTVAAWPDDMLMDIETDRV